MKRNLLAETVVALTEEGFDTNDVSCVEVGGADYTWADFASVAATIDYDSEHSELDDTMRVVLSRDAWLERVVEPDDYGYAGQGEEVWVLRMAPGDFWRSGPPLTAAMITGEVVTERPAPPVREVHGTASERFRSRLQDLRRRLGATHWTGDAPDGVGVGDIVACGLTVFKVVERLHTIFPPTLILREDRDLAVDNPPEIDFVTPIPTPETP